MSWEKVKLGDVSESCLGKMLDQRKNKGTYKPYLANVNVRWGSFDLDNLQEMKFEDDEDERYGIKYGDLIICEGGEPGRCAIWKEELPNMKIQKALHRVRVNEEMDYRYVYYWFLLAGKQGALKQYYTGATIMHMPGQRLKEVVIDKPPLDVQRQIGHYLESFDNLIDNNQKQIKLLEEATQRLYKEWFVNLHFPGHENVKIVDGVPEGWTKPSMNDIADYLNGYAFKPDDWNDKGKPIIKIKEMNEGIIPTTPRNDGRAIPEKYNVIAGDILFSWSATLAAMIWDSEDGLLNQHLFKVTPNNGVCREYVLQSILKTLDEFKNLTTGSTMKHIQRGKLKEVFVNLPSQEIMDKFASIADVYREMVLRLQKQNSALKEARDRLLPRLMNGEIEI
ncbi:restriction endonuclease subunit S [Schaedlerella arabinosiphila]|uniref:restriction endonuclease subunit S n=1 Tax=Schaedlerella arabinosiphila TaxID=2044587 RepID=UPI002558216E|nr:restriction endonuclease subunit S [Schaedlerella arabinosiphila]